MIIITYQYLLKYINLIEQKIYLHKYLRIKIKMQRNEQNDN